MSRIFDTDKRRYLRYEVLDYAVVFPDDGGDSCQTVIVDIGLGGLQIRSRTELPVGCKCRLHVGRLDKNPLVLRGEVRHTAAIKNSDLISTGIRFLPESHEERLAIAEFVHAIFQRQCDMLAL